MTELGALRSPEVPRAVLAVPLGATEQHGPHLPLHTDTAIAVELSERLAARVAGVVVAPPLPFGSSGEHAGFAGTLSIGGPALELVVLELVRSADHFAATVLVNGHGGNAAPLARAVRTLREEGRKVLSWAPSGRADDSHAGRTETSVMLALRPAEVRRSAARAGNTEPLPRLWDRLRQGGVRTVSGNGVLGDPDGASAVEGEELLATWSDALVSTVRDWLGQ